MKKTGIHAINRFRAALRSRRSAAMEGRQLAVDHFPRELVFSMYRPGTGERCAALRAYDRQAREGRCG